MSITTDGMWCQSEHFPDTKVDPYKLSFYFFYNLFTIFFVLHFRASIFRVQEVVKSFQRLSYKVQFWKYVSRNRLWCAHFFARFKLFSFVFYWIVYDLLQIARSGLFDIELFSLRGIITIVIFSDRYATTNKRFIFYMACIVFFFLKLFKGKIADVGEWSHNQLGLGQRGWSWTPGSLRWPNTVLARALADAIQHVHKDCKNKHAVDTAIILFAQCPLYLCYFSS